MAVCLEESTWIELYDLQAWKVRAKLLVVQGGLCSKSILTQKFALVIRWASEWRVRL